MTKRLKIDVAGTSPIFKLSKPGYDVETATDEEVLFDIAGGTYGGIFMQGIVPISSFTSSTEGNFYGYSTYLVYEVNFGKTFSKLPKVLFSTNDPLLGSGYFGPMYQPNSVAFFTSLTGCFVDVAVEVFTSKIRLLMTRSYYSGTLYPYPSSMSYVIFHG